MKQLESELKAENERKERRPRIEAASVMGMEKRRVMSSIVNLGFDGDDVEAAPLAATVATGAAAEEGEGCAKNESGSGDVIRSDPIIIVSL